MKKKTISATTATLALIAASTFSVVSGCSNERRNAAKENEPFATVDGAAPRAATPASLPQKPPVSAEPSAALAGPPPANPTETILAGASADCLACARALRPETHCDLASITCETLPEGSARQQCLDTLRCAVPGGGAKSCVNGTSSSLTPCYCGTMTVEDCLSPGRANGVCKRVIETGLGTTDPVFVARNITNRAHPAGVGMKIAQCLADAARAFDPKCRRCL